MNCHQVNDLFLDFLSASLDAADRVAVSEHLASCDGCRTRAEGFRMVSRTLDAWETPEISPWFNARLRQRIAEEEARVWNWRVAFGWLRRPATAAAFAAVLMVASAAVWMARPAPKPVPVEARQNPQTDELMSSREDFDMLADFEVITELNQNQKTTKPNSKM